MHYKKSIGIVKFSELKCKLCWIDCRICSYMVVNSCAKIELGYPFFVNNLYGHGTSLLRRTREFGGLMAAGAVSKLFTSIYF